MNKDNERRKQFFEEVLMLADQYRLTKDDILDIFGMELLNINEDDGVIGNIFHNQKLLKHKSDD